MAFPPLEKNQSGPDITTFSRGCILDEYDFNFFIKYKTVEAIFADEPNEVAVITVKVYYSNEEADR